MENALVPLDSQADNILALLNKKRKTRWEELTKPGK